MVSYYFRIKISRYKRAVIRDMSRHQTANPMAFVPEAGNGEANVHLAVATGRDSGLFNVTPSQEI